MNIRDGDDCSAADMLDTSGVSALWPGSSSDDIIRRQLAALLLEDPDHRLRVAHLEPLLQLRVDATCSSGRLQALLTDPDNARIFPVDFSNTRVADWRSRVVYLDTRQLAAEVASAKQHQHAASGLSSGRTSCEPPSSHHSHLASANGSGARGADAPAGDLSGSAYLLQQQAASLAAGNLGGLQDGRPSLSGSLGQQPMMLETIFGASPGFGGQQGRGGQADRSEQPAAGRAGGGGAGSYGTTVVGSAGAGDARPAGMPGLFGGSFEVPHAIASCWAPSSSCGSGTGSDRQAPPPHHAGKPHHHHHHGPAALDAHDACGGSSTASGSSSRSVGAATNRAAAAAAASRLRKASSGQHASEYGDCAPGGGGGQQQQLPAVCSSGALSGLDGSTPKSCGHADDASASSPVNSSACEDEVEYTEAQLVFGLPGAAGGAGGAGGDATPAASATPGTARTRDGGDGAEGGGLGEGAGDAAGDAPPLHGVDWSKVAALQHQQHQQHQPQAAGSWQAALARSQGQGALLFGLDDRHDEPQLSARGVGGGMAGGSGGQGFGLGLASLSAAAASGALAARRLMMEPQSHHQADLGGQGFLGSSVGLGYRGGGGAAGSAPVDTTGLLFMPGGSIDGLMGAGGAMAAYGTSAGMGTGLAGFHSGIGGGIGGAAAAATAAELAESVLLDAECGLGPQHAAQQQGAPGYGAHISSSYSSAGLLSERSNSGCWGASPAAHGYALAAAQQQQQRQQQQQAAGEAAGDISLRSDQLKELVGRAAAAGGGGGGMPGKPEAGGSATADNKAAGAGAGNPSAPGAAPRLTGWASIAAREPKAAAPLTPRSAAAAARDAHAGGVRQQQQLAAAAGGAAGGGGKAGDAGKALHKLPVRVRSEVYGLVAQYAGVLKADDFDEGVVHQLNAKRSEEEAVAAVRHVAHYDLANIQHMAAYLNHLVKHYNHNAAAAAAAAGSDGSSAVVGGGGPAPAAPPGPAAAARTAAGAAGGAGNGGQLLAAQGCSLGSTLGGRGGGGGGGGAASGAAAAAAAGSLGAYGGQIRLASVPVSTKSMLQKLPLKVFRQLEQLVAGCAFLEWRHFDAGVVKVLAQLSKLCEADVFEELELLAATDLSNVEYMPAYLNKRLNNKLWSRRKAMGEVPSG